MVWLAGGGGEATALQAPLGQSLMNCETADVDSTRGVTTLAGNCPAGNNGFSEAVLWTSATAPYVNLPRPAGALFCTAAAVNTRGQVMGNCKYANDSYKAVRWAAGGTTAPIVLASLIGGGAILRSSGVTMTSTGHIGGTYLGSGGFTMGFDWDPDSGTAATAFGPPAGGIRVTVVGMSANDFVVGLAEVGNGDMHAYHWSPATGTVDDQTLPGGHNSGATAISKSGHYVAGWSEAGTGEGFVADTLMLP